MSAALSIAAALGLAETYTHSPDGYVANGPDKAGITAIYFGHGGLFTVTIDA